MAGRRPARSVSRASAGVRGWPGPAVHPAPLPLLSAPTPPGQRHRCRRPKTPLLASGTAAAGSASPRPFPAPPAASRRPARLARSSSPRPFPAPPAASRRPARLARSSSPRPFPAPPAASRRPARLARSPASTVSAPAPLCQIVPARGRLGSPHGHQGVSPSSLVTTP